MKNSILLFLFCFYIISVQFLLSEEKNLSLDVIAFWASGEFSPQYPAEYAVDGNNSTIWGSNSINSPQENIWFIVELNRNNYDILTRIVLRYYAPYYPKVIKFGCSNIMSSNVNDWILSGPNYTGGQDSFLNLEKYNINFRYIGFLVQKFNLNDNALGIKEFEVYGNVNLNYYLVSYYPFNGNADDEGDNNKNDGTIQGAALTADRFGNLNSAYSFDGIDDTIEIPDHPSLDIVNAITIEAWIKVNKIDGTVSLISKSSCTVNNGFIFPYFTTINRMRIITHTGRWDLSGGWNWASLSDPYEWHHVVGTFDGLKRKNYVDGLLKYTQSQSGKITTNNNDLVIGNQPGCGEYFDGLMDDIKIYNRALTDVEVKQLYDNSK